MSSLRALFNPGAQIVQHSSYLVDFTHDSIRLLWLNITEVTGYHQKVLRLGERSLRNVQKARIVLATLTFRSLRDISGNGEDCPAKL